MEILEQIIVFIAKQGGQHGRLVLYPNRSGAVYNSTGNVLTTFSSLDDLVKKLGVKHEKRMEGQSQTSF
jgi:hypothetical protein